MKIIKTIALLIALVAAGAQAQVPLKDVRDAKYDGCGRFEFWHINGIMTDLPGARDNLKRLSEVYGNAYREHLIVYGLAYNQTRGFAPDMVASATQVIRQYIGATWDNFMQAVTFGFYSVGMPKATSDAIAKKIVAAWGFNQANPYNKDIDLAEIVNSINTTGQKSAKKLLIGHSQGTLYMNEVYDRLVGTGFKATSIGAIGIAAATNIVRTGNTYLTSDNDTVVDSVRVATALINPLNNVLPANVSIPRTDALGHNLRSVYLNDANVRSKLKGMITAEFASLKSYSSGTYWPVDWYGNDHVVYAHSQWSNAIGTGVPPEGVPMYLAYQSVAPYALSQYIGKTGGTLAETHSITKANGQLCYSYAIALMKKQKAAGNYGWAEMGYPNYRGCWSSLAQPAGAWLLYSGDAPPVFRTWEDTHPYYRGRIYVEGGMVCKG